MRHATSARGASRRALAWVALCLAAWTTPSTSAGTCAAAEATGRVVLERLRQFRELGSVLYVAAHPDDENTQLITYLARGRRYRTAYLSVTRGDGGQNLLGPEFGAQLGVIRTQELLAARRIDGGRQFFTRAIDFGFSKSDQETLAIWDRQAVLGDVVRVIRTFRPDIVVTRFSPRPSGTHGHHTASAVLALDAFRLAGDAQAFPEQLAELDPWQPNRILQNSGGRWRDGGPSATEIEIDIAGEDAVTRTSFAEIAGQSRAMHKSQGFGNFAGFRGGGGPRSDSFELLDGEPATDDIMDGVDTTWNRVDGGQRVGQLVDAAIAGFHADKLADNVPALLEVRAALAELPSDPLACEKQQQFDSILADCLGITVETTVPNAEVVPGESVELHHRASVESTEPVRWVSVRYPLTGNEIPTGVDLVPNSTVSNDSTVQLPTDTLLSQPYWLRTPGSVGMSRVDDASLIGAPENRPAMPCEFVFEVGRQTLVVPTEPVEASRETEGANRPLAVVAPVAIEFAAGVQLFAPQASSSVEVDVVAYRSGISGKLRLRAPVGWKVEPEWREWSLSKPGDRQRLGFQVTAPDRQESTDISAETRVDGVRYANSRIEIRYEHIPRQLLQPEARLRAVSLDLAIRGKRVGYIAGAGDDVADCLAQMGYEVTSLVGDDLTPEGLAEFDAVVIGIRALNTRADLEDRMPALFDFVERGGNAIVQYNRPNDLRVREPAPYRLRLSGGRVTDENARIERLAPDHAALNTPNKILPADFDGWVQERGLYFPEEWDEAFTPLVACGDPGETPLAGGVLVAKHGQGHFVYTAFAWFRQLPAGVPGAYRLFANLVSLGK
jgi:LmbE family N-acetylglucosaminyl deacetylase